MEKTVKLYSLQPEKYPDKVMKVQFIENHGEKLDEICTNEVLSAVKTATVKARRAQLGEVVDTRPRVTVGGKKYTFSETKQVITEDKVKSGAIIVTNPDGEEYVISSLEKFNSKYKSDGKGGYVSIDTEKKFRVSNGNYAIRASWGEEQIVLKGSLFCVENPEKAYGITNSAFNSTYNIVSKTMLPEPGQ